MDLDARKQKILQAIIQDYISSAEPVGSRTIARKYDLGVSAATIRNEMFDLEIMGYLEQPHTSSGRIPSLKGYRFYVDCLLKPTKITDAEKQFVRAWFQDKVSSVDQIFQSTAKLLARITHNVTLVMASQRLNSKLKYIRFLPLDDRRAIMIVVTDTGQVENCIYPNPAGASLDDLNIIAQRLTNYLAGMAMDHIDEKAIEAFHETIVDDVELYRLAFRAMGRAFHKDQQFYKGGTMELLNKPEFKDGEGGAVTVRIGEEAKLSSINDCSIIEATFTDHDVVLGKLAVLGPARMEYAKIIGLLDFMKQHVTHMLAHYHDDK